MNFEKFLVDPPFPQFAQFETGTACNAECIMCPHDQMKRQGTAKWSLISKIIREVAPKVHCICPFLMQEPFLERRLPAILANIKQWNRKCVTGVYSNMAYVPDAMMRQIIDCDLLDELHISFYGPTEELYRKWQPPFNRAVTVQNIKKFFRYRQLKNRLKPKIDLHVIMVPELMEAVGGYKDVLDFVDDIEFVRFDTFHGDVPDMAGDVTEYLGPPKPRTPCNRLWATINVHFDGSVVPCCIDYNAENVLGNACKDSLDDVWHNSNFVAFRQLHLEGRWNEIPMCRDCQVHEYAFNKEWVDYWLNQK